VCANCLCNECTLLQANGVLLNTHLLSNSSRRTLPKLIRALSASSAHFGDTLPHTPAATHTAEENHTSSVWIGPLLHTHSLLLFALQTKPHSQQQPHPRAPISFADAVHEAMFTLPLDLIRHSSASLPQCSPACALLSSSANSSSHLPHCSPVSSSHSCSWTCASAPTSPTPLASLPSPASPPCTRSRTSTSPTPPTSPTWACACGRLTYAAHWLAACVVLSHSSTAELTSQLAAALSAHCTLQRQRVLAALCVDRLLHESHLSGVAAVHKLFSSSDLTLHTHLPVSVTRTCCCCAASCASLSSSASSSPSSTVPLAHVRASQSSSSPQSPHPRSHSAAASVGVHQPPRSSSTLALASLSAAQLLRAVDQHASARVPDAPASLQPRRTRKRTRKTECAGSSQSSSAHVMASKGGRAARASMPLMFDRAVTGLRSSADQQHQPKDRTPHTRMHSAHGASSSHPQCAPSLRLTVAGESTLAEHTHTHTKQAHANKASTMHAARSTRLHTQTPLSRAFPPRIHLSRRALPRVHSSLQVSLPPAQSSPSPSAAALSSSSSWPQPPATSGVDDTVRKEPHSSLSTAQCLPQLHTPSALPTHLRPPPAHRKKPRIFLL
jgi:hypothetical protein